MPYRDRHPLAEPAGSAHVRPGLSAAAIAVARDLAASAGAEIDFHVADAYDAATVLGAGTYDLVFTGIEGLGWLPDVERWAQVVSDLLRPGGRLLPASTPSRPENPESVS